MTDNNQSDHNKWIASSSEEEKRARCTGCRKCLPVKFPERREMWLMRTPACTWTCELKELPPGWMMPREPREPRMHREPEV